MGSNRIGLGFFCEYGFLAHVPIGLIHSDNNGSDQPCRFAPNPISWIYFGLSHVVGIAYSAGMAPTLYNWAELKSSLYG